MKESEIRGKYDTKGSKALLRKVSRLAGRKRSVQMEKEEKFRVGFIVKKIDLSGVNKRKKDFGVYIR